MGVENPGPEPGSRPKLKLSSADEASQVEGEGGGADPACEEGGQRSDQAGTEAGRLATGPGSRRIESPSDDEAGIQDASLPVGRCGRDGGRARAGGVDAEKLGHLWVAAEAMELVEILAWLKFIPSFIGKLILSLWGRIRPRSLALSVMEIGGWPHLDEGSVATPNGRRSITSLGFKVMATNVTAKPVTVSAVRGCLLFPKWYLPLAWSRRHPPICAHVEDPFMGTAPARLRPDQSVVVSVHATFGFSPPTRARAPVRVEVTDQRDRAHRTKWTMVAIGTFEKSAAFRAQDRARQLKLRRHTEERVQELQKRGHAVDVLEGLVAALRVEVDKYGINGRERGTLGSIIFTHHGVPSTVVPTLWRHEGNAAQNLVAPDPENSRIESGTSTTIVAVLRRAYGDRRERSIEVVRAFMHRESEFAPVAYLLVLVAQDLGFLDSAVEIADEGLRGDAGVGYSEVFHLLSAMVRFTHNQIPDSTLRLIERKATELGDAESFQLPLLISHVRLLRAQGPGAP